MNERQLEKKIAKAKRIRDRCRAADVEPAKWVTHLLDNEREYRKKIGRLLKSA